MLSSPASRSVRPFPTLSPPLPRLPIPSNPALLRPPLPRDCRLPSSLLCSNLRFPDASDALSPYLPCAIRYPLSAMRAVSSSNNSPRPNRAYTFKLIFSTQLANSPLLPPSQYRIIWHIRPCFFTRPCFFRGPSDHL